MPSGCSYPKPIVVIVLLLPAAFLWCNLADARIGIDADAAMIEKICKQSQDYQFCFNIFNSDPRTPAADMDGLVQLSVSITINYISDTMDKFPDLAKRINDPVGKQRLSVCQSDYTDASAQFHGAYDAAEKRSYYDVIDWVRNGTNEVIDCEDIYRRTDPIGVSPITGDNRNVYKLSEMILIIVDGLLPH